MKSFRWTYVLGLVVASLVAFTLYDYRSSLKSEELKEKELSVLRISPDEATRLEISTRTGAALVIEKRGERWHLTTPVQDEADPQAVETFLATLESEKVLETIPIGPETDLKTFGLDKPFTWLKVQGSGGQSQELKIGSVKAYDSNLYAQQGTEPNVLLVDQGWDVHLTKRADELRDKRLYREDEKPVEIKRVEIRSRGAKVPSVVFVKEGDEWKNVKGGDGFPIRSSAVGDYIDKVQSLRANRVVGPRDDKRTLAAVGLDRPALELKFYSDVEPGKDSGAATASPVFEASFSKKETKSDGSPAVIHAVSSHRKEILSIFASSGDAVFKTTQHFYDRSLPFQFSVADVAKMKIESPEVSAEFTKKDGAWESDRVAETIEMLSRMEAIRILGPETGKVPLKNPSKIVLTKPDGEKVFEFAWGKSTMDKSDESGLEVQYHPASTSAVDRQIRVTERNVEALGLAALKEK